MSLRVRLVVGAAATVAVAIILASGLVYFLVRNELSGQVDQALQQSAATVGGQHLHYNPFHPLYRPHVYEIFSGGGLLLGYYQLVDGAGNAYVPDYLLGNGPLLSVTARAMAVAAGRAVTYYYDTRFAGNDDRVLTIATVSSRQPGLPGDKRYAIQVVESLAGVDNELSRIKLWLFLVSLGGVAVASGAGLLVARSTLRPVRDLSETAERVRATRDLSQRIAVEGSDELSQLALTFNEMLAALDEAATRQQRLVEDASHELRTPLTSLRTNIEVLADGGALSPEDRSQLLRDVIAQLGEMTALVSELTELARGEEQSTGLEEVRLDLVAEEAVRRTVRNHPEVSVEAELAPTIVVGNGAGLERAIANLLDNAAKWSPAGSVVEVRLADGLLTVRDHGPGIGEADAPHIFERFYRATSARSMPGSGLGLSIVRRVAEAHGGTIAFEPAPGGGTLMRLRLPLAELNASPGEAPGEASGGGRELDGSDETAPKPPRARLGAGRSRLRSASPGGTGARGARSWRLLGRRGRRGRRGSKPSSF